MTSYKDFKNTLNNINKRFQLAHKNWGLNKISTKTFYTITGALDTQEQKLHQSHPHYSSMWDMGK